MSDDRPMSAIDNARLKSASRRVYPESGIRDIIKRARFVARARKMPVLMSRLLDSTGALGRCVEQRPEVIGLVDAPFVNARWDSATRIETFLRQFAYLESLGAPFDFDVTHSIELPHVADLGDDYLLVLDKPGWFQREGLLTLNIFRENLRLFSLSFSFDELDGKRTAMIGAIQGRRIQGALDEYRQITKLAHGVRPRDLLIDCLRMIAATAGAERIVAVSDACRHHRHRFFSRDVDRELPLDYDEIWKDRGGVEIDGGFFELPPERQVRPLETISSKKRSMYNKRYAMLDRLQGELEANLTKLQPVIRPEAD